MIRHFLTLLATTWLIANPLTAGFVTPEFHHIVGTSLYEGTKKGEFKGDLVALFDDGSCWKIHPKQKKQFLKWQIEDDIRVSARSEFYWFKREHKFSLVNHSSKESIKAMLIEFPPDGPRVVSAKVFIASVSPGSSYTDKNNKTTTIPPSIHYGKQLVLSDGTIWNIYTKLEQYVVGDAIYVGTFLKKKDAGYILMSGRATNANWAKAYKVVTPLY